MAMPIYGQISANRRRTFLLFFFFSILFTAVGYGLGYYLGEPVTGIITAAFIMLILFFISYYSGAKIVTAMAGAREVKRKEEPYLYHTIEGLSIAAGLPTPKAYIIETDVPNAFAAGNRPENSVVAVTRGLLQKLNRAELEGVIAHELSHIKNRDVLLATVAVVLAGTIVFICDIMLRHLWYRPRMQRRSRNQEKNQMLVMVVVLLLAFITPIFARILQFSISRQREYLADASAAELTGYPLGLASALEKIAGLQPPDNSLDNRALNGLYIISPALGAKGKVAGLFATHPPIEKRIQRLREM